MKTFQHELWGPFIKNQFDKEMRLHDYDKAGSDRHLDTYPNVHNSEPPRGRVVVKRYPIFSSGYNQVDQKRKG